jgi:F0F1-type ATP synthase assembly protein I
VSDDREGAEAQRRLLAVLGRVTALVAIPILAGAIAGIVVDRILGSSPFWLLTGFIAGNLVAVAGVWLYVHRQRRGMAGPGGAWHNER